MLDLLLAVKQEVGIQVHAYCLMSNHVHLLLHANAPQDLPRSMSKLLGPYATWFNKKYGRSGALIANRYKSTCIEDDAYLFAVIRYIHKNPMDAGMVSAYDQYQWSSFTDYVSGQSELIDSGFILSMFSPDRVTAVDRFISFHSQAETLHISSPDRPPRTSKQIHDGIVGLLGDVSLHSVSGLPKGQRDTIIKSLRQHHFSIRQIERVTGIPRGIIAKVTI